MDFNLTDERRMLQDSLGRFLTDNYDHEKRRKVIASGVPYDAEVFAGLAELGVLGALFSEDDGGFGGAGFDISVVFEELGRAGVIEPVLPAVLAVSLLGNNAELVEAIISGEAIVALAHAEPVSRYDLNHVTTTVSAGVLNGTKAHVLNGAQATHLIVSARESGDDWSEEGIALFLVDPAAKASPSRIM